MTIGLPHPNILPYIPRNLLCAVHATVCNLRGRQWGSQRPSLLFVSRHSFQHLVAYHRHILHELRSRGFKPSPKWSDPLYRGRKVDPWPQVVWRREHPGQALHAHGQRRAHAEASRRVGPLHGRQQRRRSLPWQARQRGQPDHRGLHRNDPEDRRHRLT